MPKRKRLVTVYALMYFQDRKSLCAIFSSKKRAEAYASRLTKKLTQKDEHYIVDAWHVNGATTSF
jgi:hypothetical protein